MCLFCVGLHNSTDLNSREKDVLEYRASLLAYIMQSFAHLFLTTWTLPAAPPSSGTRCQWRHSPRPRRSPCCWSAPGCDSSSASSRPSPWSDSRWTDAASCGLFWDLTWRVDLQRNVMLLRVYYCMLADNAAHDNDHISTIIPKHHEQTDTYV